MGIKNLTRFLTQQFPELLEDVTLKDFAGKKIAIDTAIFMCKFKASSGKNWLDAFVSLVSWMWECGVTPIFVLDNGSPPEKAIEKKKRYEAKKKSLEKIAALEKAIETYKVDKIVTPLLKEVHQKESKNEENSSKWDEFNGIFFSVFSLKNYTPFWGFQKNPHYHPPHGDGR